MANYDSSWEKASRDDILEVINHTKLTIEKYEDNEKLLEADLESVKNEISIELIRNESDKMVRWQLAYQRELTRLNKLLKRHDEGFEISKYEVGI